MLRAIGSDALGDPMVAVVPVWLGVFVDIDCHFGKLLVQRVRQIFDRGAELLAIPPNLPPNLTMI